MTLPARANLAGAPDNASFATAIGQLYDTVKEKVGSDTGAGPVTVASASSVNLTAVTTVKDILMSGVVPVDDFVIAAGDAFDIVADAGAAFKLKSSAAIDTKSGLDIDMVAGDSCRVRATAPNVVEVLFLTRASAETTSKIQSIDASVASNAMTLTVNPTVLDFRSATLGSGAVNRRAITSPISTVISSGSTGGTTNGVKSRIAVVVIDNGSSQEVAWVNVVGSVGLDEAGVISTIAEGGAGGADSAGVFYSTTARSNVPYHLQGYVESTQAAAGTWATPPSLIQGQGGQAMAALTSLGHGQKPQSVARTSGVNYTSPGRTITLVIGISTNSSCVVTVDGHVYPGVSCGNTNIDLITIPISPNVVYSYTATGTVTVNEIR